MTDVQKLALAIRDAQFDPILRRMLTRNIDLTIEKYMQLDYLDGRSSSRIFEDLDAEGQNAVPPCLRPDLTPDDEAYLVADLTRAELAEADAVLHKKVVMFRR
jgi:hypothetical protein